MVTVYNVYEARASGRISQEQHDAILGQIDRDLRAMNEGRWADVSSAQSWSLACCTHRAASRGNDDGP